MSEPMYLSLEPWQVEHGDIILGLRSPVASILTDGRAWFYSDSHGTIVAKRSTWGRVQVIRDSAEGCDSADSGGSSVTALPAATSQDDCPPHGIARPRNGLHVVIS